MGLSKDHTGIIIGSKCNRTSVLKRSHLDLDEITVSKI